MITLNDLTNLALGVTDRLEVGRLDPLTANLIGATTPIVFLSRESLQHIRHRHPVLTAEEYLLLPAVIRNGLIIKETRRPTHIVISFQGAEEIRRYITVIKVTRGGHELYVKTLHRARERQTKALLTRGRILRNHK